MLKITFVWEEDAAMGYDELIDKLMQLGAEDIEDEPYERTEVYKSGGPKKRD